MKFNLNHDPNNKTLAIPRAALQLSGLAGVSDLILHTDSGCILLLPGDPTVAELLKTISLISAVAPQLISRLAERSQMAMETGMTETACGACERKPHCSGLEIPPCQLAEAGISPTAALESFVEEGRIIVQAADMLLPGGMMFYSTCTFSPLENEKTITHLLKERPDMEVVPMEDYENFAEGLTSYKDEAFDESCKLCRRIWPHKMSGEGHFMALLHKKSGAEQEIKSDEQDSVMQNINYLQAENSKESGLNRTFHMNQEANTSEILNRDKKENTIKYQQDAEPVFDRKNIEISQKSDEKASKKSKKAKKKQQTETLSSVWWEKCKSLSKEQKAAAEDFFAHVNIAYDVGRIDVRGDNLYYLPEPQYDGRGLHFLRNGLFMGEFKKKRFEPSQPFALVLRAQDFDQVLDFPADDERLQRYLRGETLDVSDLINGEKKRKGWQLVMAAGHPLGFGKLVNNNLKNKYPAGWRK